MDNVLERFSKQHVSEQKTQWKTCGDLSLSHQFLNSFSYPLEKIKTLQENP